MIPRRLREARRRAWFTPRPARRRPVRRPDLDTPIDLLPADTLGEHIRSAAAIVAPAALVDAELESWREYAQHFMADHPGCTCRTCRVLDGAPDLAAALWRGIVRELERPR